MLKLPIAIRTGLILIVATAATCRSAVAALSVIGDVTAAIDGVPIVPYEVITRSEINTEEDIGAQTSWEQPKDIIVGVKLIQGGRMDIDGTTQVRYENLIIGSKGTQNGIERTGSGTVLITGNGALYSNDPTSLPPELEGTGFGSANPRPADEGFDVIVGEWGQGRLELRNGGRAEIQDAVIVGHNPGANGVVIVDGFGTLLGNGGFSSNQLLLEPHQMTVGRHGVGQMFITNGGLVVSEGPAGSAVSDEIVGAVIGSDAFEENEIPEFGGYGEVTVSGIASRWIVGGSLQLGGFHDVFVGALQDVAGENVNYNGPDGRAGAGVLKVLANGLVQVRNPLGVTDPDDQELRLAIGRFGILDLQGGVVVVGSGGGTPTQPESTPDEVQVVNDGLITGFGRLETGVFRNRYFGQVRVLQGQSLLVDSTAEFLSGDPNAAYPLVNFGLIEVIGTEDLPAELEFVRPPAALGNPLTPLINRPVATTAGPAPTTFDGGLISAQHSRLRFTSGDTATDNIGMKNEGVMAFTAGTNIITGAVVNQIGPDPGALNPKFIIGPDTTVVVEDDFTVDAAVVGPGPGVVTGPIVDFGQGASLIVLDQSTLTLAGVLNMDLSLSNPTHIEASGDVGLGGFLNVTLASDTLATLAHGSSFEILSFAGQAFGIDTSTGTAQPSATPLPQNLGVPMTVGISPDISVLFPNLDPVLQRINQGIFLSFLDPASVGGGATGADFNGDGVVDALDLAIWNANKGITSGASVLQGDADGDGDVDGDDYLIWLDRYTNGGTPGSGGSNFAAPSGNVPEPTGLALLSLAGLLAATFWRRRA